MCTLCWCDHYFLTKSDVNWVNLGCKGNAYQPKRNPVCLLCEDKDNCISIFTRTMHKLEVEPVLIIEMLL